MSETDDPTGRSGRPLNIVHLLPCLYLGGAEHHVQRLIRFMPRDHYDFRLVAPDGPGQVLFDPDEVPRRHFRRLELDVLSGFSSVRKALAAEAERQPIDIVHVHIESALLWFAKKVLPGVPRVYTAHGIVGMAAAKYWITARTLNRWADLSCFVSRHDMARMQQSGADPARLRLVSNGVAVPPSSPDGRKAMAARLGIDRERDVVVGTLARLEPEKGLDVLIRAVAGLHGRLPRLRLVIAGTGGQEAKLRGLITELGCEDRVQLAGFTSDVGDFLGNLDIYAQPSRAEAFGLGVTEAMASGLPVVASRVGGLPEQVTEEVTGLLVPPGDVEALAAAIARLAGDADLRIRLGAGGKAVHAAQFSPEQLSRSMAAVYAEAVAR